MDFKGRCHQKYWVVGVTAIGFALVLSCSKDRKKSKNDQPPPVTIEQLPEDPPENPKDDSEDIVVGDAETNEDTGDSQEVASDSGDQGNGDPPSNPADLPQEENSANDSDSQGNIANGGERIDYPATCTEYRQGRIVNDVEDVYLFHKGVASHPWRAVCAGLKSPTPEAFLALKKATGKNYSTFITRDNIKVVTTYEAVRIDPETLAIDRHNQRFAETVITGGPSVDQSVSYAPYGLALDCYNEGATGNIDLTDAFVAIADFEQVSILMGDRFREGSTSVTGKSVELTVKGECSWLSASGSESPGNKDAKLQLIYDIEERDQALPVSCAAVNNAGEMNGAGDYKLYLNHDPHYPVPVYCHNENQMFYEYLNVAEDTNFSSFLDRDGNSLRVNFQKLRVMLPASGYEVKIFPADFRFAVSQSSHTAARLGTDVVEQIAWGSAYSCLTDTYAKAAIDLGLTPFRLKVHHGVFGHLAKGGEVSRSADDKNIVARIAGECSWTSLWENVLNPQFLIQAVAPEDDSASGILVEFAEPRVL